MITEDYVSFEIAKLLKEKGFNEDVNSYFISDNEIALISNRRDFNNHGIYLSAPTLQMAMKWLREVHGLHIQALCPVVDVDCDTLGVAYNVVISNLRNHCLAFDTPLEDVEYNTYEKACESAIKYCLEHLI